MRNNDFSINLASGDIALHNSIEKNDWNVTLANTGLTSMTGARIKRIEKYIGDDDTFMVTYGDGVADINITKLVDFHNNHGKIGTVTGVYPPSRYGELKLSGDNVLSFEEKPDTDVAPISVGFFVFNKEIFEYLDDDENCVLEKEPLANLAKDGELNAYHHDGFWQCMDTYRDYSLLNNLWIKNDAPWKVW